MTYSKFRAKEVVRSFPKDSSLSIIVPSGSRYAYDIISKVGFESLVAGKRLSEIKHELESVIPNLNIPFSSLYDQQRKFLFYFGELHRQATPSIKEYLHSFDRVNWLIDGTLEPGSDVFFGVKECQKYIMLDCFKIATENERDICSCLRTVGESFGPPDEIVHDLSKIIQKACQTVYSDVVQRVCHFHFTRDVGKDLYELPQEMLTNRLRKLKLQLHLKDQRKKQNQWLRHAVDDKQVLILENLLKDKQVAIIDNEVLGREIFLSLNYWMLDYANDGKRQGYPFDPYLLYFHRRITKVYESIHKIVASALSETGIPQCLSYLLNKLEIYFSDREVTRASSLYEEAFSIFNDIRASLRLLDISENTSPIYESFEISPLEQNEIINNIFDLKSKLNEQMQSTKDAAKKNLYDIALKHINKYEPYLVSESNLDNVNYKMTRTTNKLEQHWGNAKRTKRRVTGKKKLTREFNSLPKEFMLVQNLNNQDYVDLVIGDIEKLPEKLAEAGKHAGPFSRWAKQQNVKNGSKIAKHLLRKNEFLNDLIEICYPPTSMN
jgi:hypothetical protein